ncbi:membrane protein insertion efficiency factor YidD [Streptomyces sp. bgisy100]|uniref:membrane protein insertion efficiency factor YidD n=1 Tax=Streptomyces sp. bgisy100 TaxID=3413783 RepID=UPI003D727585
MKYPLLWLIKLYQWTISPLLGPVCKYYPSCSHYGYQAIDAHGAVKGTALTAWRILRCNPWSLGGVDHVPPRKHPVWHQRLRSRWSGRSSGTPAGQAETQPNAQGA